MSRGFFITFEGLDGSGKSTQLKLLARWLKDSGYNVLATRQPGGTNLGDQIRRLLLHSKTRNVAPLAEMALMFADRAQSIHQVILPALEAGQIVLCDRFTDSTEAYQGGGRELGSARVLALDAQICGGLMPDLTLLLLPNLDASLARARERNRRGQTNVEDENRFESETRTFYERVFRKYREIAARDSARVVVVDSEEEQIGSDRQKGKESIDAIHQRIVKIVDERLATRHAPSST